MKKRFLAFCLMAWTVTAHAWTVSVGTWVCNPDASVTVPVSIDDAEGLAYVGVRINYDPQVLVCLRVERGGLDGVLDGDFLAADDEAGMLSFARFRASESVAPSGGGVLARAVFAVRPGTARQYSDLAIADIRLGDDSGVRDLALAGTIAPEGGMVRIFPENGAAARLEGAQTIAADTHLASLALAAGDSIQASVAGTPVCVSGETSTEGQIPVLAPEGGWVKGTTYALLKTATKGLSFVAAGDSVQSLDVVETDEDGMSLYSLRIEGDEAPEITADTGESLGTAATAYVRSLFGGEEAVSRIVVSGGEKNVLLASWLGIKPAEVRMEGVLEATFAAPTIEVIDYDAATGVIRVRVTPGPGNTIASELVKGVVRLCGGATPADLDNLLDAGCTVDVDGYLQPSTEGEFTLSNALLDFGPSAFFRIAIVATP